MSSDNRSLSKNIYSSTFSSFCQEVSRFRLSHMIRTTDVSVEKLPKGNEQPPLGDWMVVVFAYSKFFRLTLKIHYSDNEARRFANLSQGTDALPLSITTINDFMREYGNQVIGAVKQSVEEQSGYAKISCPLVTRGQDAEFFAPNPACAAFEDQWLLQVGDYKTQCSIILEFLDKNFMKKIFLPAFLDAEAVGDVEFFE